MIQRIKLHIKGVVQGVGLRPYVYNLSKRFGLAGFVLNDLKGVTIEVEGPKQRLKKFKQELRNNAPTASFIDAINEEILIPKGERNFSIKESKKSSPFGTGRFTFVSKDLAVCPDCLKELFNKDDPRYLYPFINCTNCGPRFTIIKDMPYDRPQTTMKDFKMCRNCLSEYRNNSDRRFHAEPNACFICGPAIKLFKSTLGNEILLKDINVTLNKVASLIYKGKIIAIKGVGGYHLGCDAKNIKAVSALRKRKNRPTKPFAVMVDDLSVIEKICFLSKSERKIIQSPARPIMLLKIKKSLPWMEQVAPGHKYLGVMLAYAPLHYLIFNYLKKYDKEPVLVMTSANKKDFALVSKEEELNEINAYADYFLTHNRPIHIRLDDSICRAFADKEITIRKARGYTPDFAEFKNKKDILAVGAELKNTFSIAKNNYLIASPFIGDLKNYKNYDFFLNTLTHYKNIFSFNPQVIAHDYHPDYLSTQYAKSIEVLPKISVQHHHAHLAACLFENKVEEKTIGVCFDGIGLGLDGAAWGGEFFICDKKDFKRTGHFKYFGLLGQDKAQEEPGRIAFYLLWSIFKERIFNLNTDFISSFDRKKANIFIKLIQNNDFTPTSSIGRLFDAASTVLGLCNKVTYEAQAPIALEMLATDYKGRDENFYFSITKNNGVYIIDWQPIFTSLISDIQAKKNYAFIAYKFHFTIATIIQDMAKILRKDYGINKVGLSGGVFQNVLLLQLAVNLLKKNKFYVYYHKRFPTNDSAISVGQAVVANENTD